MPSFLVKLVKSVKLVKLVNSPGLWPRPSGLADLAAMTVEKLIPDWSGGAGQGETLS